MKMKKLLALLLVFVLALGVLSACGTTETTTSNPPAEDGDTTPAGDDATPASDVTISVAALASGYEETYPGMWQEVCDAFTLRPASTSSSLSTRTSRTSSAPPCRAASSPTSSTWPPAVRPA